MSAIGPTVETIKTKVPSKVAKRSPQKARSRVTNGARLFIDADVDQRSPVARRFRDLVQLHTADAGGPGMLSEAKAQLIRRISSIEVQLEMLEGRMVAGDATVDVEQFARISSHLRRLLESFGLERLKKDVSPTLHEIFEQYAAEQAQAVEVTALRPDPASAAGEPFLADCDRSEAAE